MEELKKRKTRMYDPWGYQEENEYQSSENQFEKELNNLFCSAKYDEEDGKIKFYNNDDVELSGSAIDVSAFTHSVIESVDYDEETKILTIVFSNGDKIEINLAELIDENEFADGLQVVDGIVSVLIDSNSDKYLSVSESGISISGIESDIQSEKERAISAETELNDRIDDIISGGSIEKLDELIEKLGYANNDTLQTTNEHEVAFGEWNVSNTDENPSGQTIFSIGIGTSEDNRKNALEVRKDGTIWATVEGEYLDITKILGQLTHEVYDADTN